MKTMYRVKWGNIKSHRVVKETAKQVVYESDWYGRTIEKREAKDSEYQTWHETWEAAHARIVADAQKRVDGLRLQLERAKGELGNAKGMKPPNTQVQP